jgi:hypothetical protein
MKWVKKRNFGKHFFDMMYFQNIQDFTSTLLRINPTTCITGFCTALVGFLSGYVYDDVYTISIIVFSFVLDLITGIYASYIKRVDEHKLDEGLKTLILSIKSNKLLRSVISMTFHFGLLAFGWHISKAQPVFGFLPTFLIGAILSTQFISVSENLYKANVIGGQFFDLIVNKLDITKIGKKKENKE